MWAGAHGSTRIRAVHPGVTPCGTAVKVSCRKKLAVPPNQPRISYCTLCTADRLLLRHRVAGDHDGIQKPAACGAGEKRQRTRPGRVRFFTSSRAERAPAACSCCAGLGASGPPGGGQCPTATSAKEVQRTGNLWAIHWQSMGIKKNDEGTHDIHITGDLWAFFDFSLT
eukprot:gene12251-biopygen7925